VDYCKKRPFIDKGPYYDIYGQTFEMAGPGRGKKKKDMINPLLLQSAKEGTPNGSQDSSPPPSALLAKPIPFPSAKCDSCNKHLSIRRMNSHMNGCIGGGGREASRNALTKIQNGNGNGSQNGNTPPGSRNGTPAPGTKRSSPNKRSPGDDFDSDTPQKKKKTIKKTATTKLKLQAPKMVKSSSQHSASNLSFESRVPNSEDEDDDNDDERDGDFGSTNTAETKKKTKPVVKKIKEVTTKKKWLYKDGKGGGVKPGVPPILPPDTNKAKQNGVDGDSPESSQTLSSPNE